MCPNLSDTNSTSLYDDAYVNDISNHGGTHGAITVGTSAVELKVGASILSERKQVTAFITTNGAVYWGHTNAVTTATGTRLFKNELYAWAYGEGTSVWLISDTAGQNVRVTECS